MRTYIYNDLGVSAEALRNTIYLMEDIEGSDVTIINHQDIISGTWTNDASLLIMPGGADLGYAEKLNGKGNAVIKRYVEGGGAYLGICAGAYYASQFVEFDMGGEQEVSGHRELAFFPGKAVGPHLAKYDYLSHSGARLAQLTLNSKFSDNNAVVYYNGGSYFAEAETAANTQVLAWYKTNHAAIIRVQVGQGQAILSGVHFEYAPELLDNSDEYLAPLIPELLKTNSTRQRLAQQIIHIYDCK
jgi:glutamine amidotransferase-like uncharacterized protein